MVSNWPVLDIFALIPDFSSTLTKAFTSALEISITLLNIIAVFDLNLKQSHHAVLGDC